MSIVSLNNYQELMNNAGYLSEEVLQEVSKKEDGFTQGMIRNVLVANPHAAKSKEVTKNLDERNNPLPEYMRQQIKLGLTTLSPKEYLEMQKANFKMQYDEAIKGALRILNSDTLNPNQTAEIINWMSNTNDINWDYQLVGYYDNNGMDALGDALLSVMESDYDLSTEKATELTRYINFRNLKSNWQQNGVNEMQLSANEIAQLEQYSEGKDKAAAKARALLILNNALDYTPPVILPNENNNKSYKKPLTEIIIEGNLSVSPNPSKDFVTVKYRIDRSYNKAFLFLLDAKGAVVMTKPVRYEQDEVLIDTQAFIKGHYTLVLEVDNVLYKSQSLIIQ